MLYTVIPLEIIYKETNENKPKEEIKTEYFPLKNGILTVKKAEQGYQIDGIFSTDMADYLNDNYIPGSIYKG